MKLATFTQGERRRVGAVVDDEIVDFELAAPDLPSDMIALLAAGDSALEVARSAAGSGLGHLSLSDVTLEAPVPRPPEFLAIGLNYSDHIEESGLGTPDFPVFFNKESSCVAGPHQAIHLPRASRALDYEGELAFVIGRACRHVPKERAHEVIAGYTIVNDVSVRDWQFKAQTMLLGKSWDTHGPMGPWITTSDELGDPHSLELQTYVNDELRQHSNTRHLVFDCFEQIEVLSTVMTLQPGTVISTGTPAGVGAAMKPARYLVAGDIVRIEIEGLGALENRVVDEPEGTARI